MPSREYVAVDEAQAEKLVEPYVEDLNITRKIGDYTLTIINNISDGNAGVLSLKLENQTESKPFMQMKEQMRQKVLILHRIVTSISIWKVQMRAL